MNEFWGKPFVPYWAMILGALIYVATRDAEKQPLHKRLMKIGASALFGIGGADAVDPYLFGGEAVATAALIIFAVVILDVASSLVSDPKLWRDLIKSRFGNGGGDA